MLRRRVGQCRDRTSVHGSGENGGADPRGRGITQYRIARVEAGSSTVMLCEGLGMQGREEEEGKKEEEKRSLSRDGDEGEGAGG